MTRARLIADGIDLAEQLRRRFPSAPLILFAHSWGSIIATGMVQQRPDLFSAYVGTGQVTGWADLVQFQFDFLAQRYKEQGDTAGLAALTAIGRPDPNNVNRYFSFSRPIRLNLNPSDTAWLAGLRSLYIANGMTESEIKSMGDGAAASGQALIGASVETDLPATATQFKIPYYVIQGQYDLFSPTPLVERYFGKVSAPKKRLINCWRTRHEVASLRPTDWSHGRRVHLRRSEDVHPAMVGEDEVPSAPRHRSARALLDNEKWPSSRASRP